MSKTIIQVNDVTMSFRMNNDRILSLKEFVTTALRGKLGVFSEMAFKYLW